MPYAFAYTEQALANLESIPAKHRRQIASKIDGLSANPFPQGHKVIRGSEVESGRIHRIRSGDYRVLYVVRSESDQIVVLDIDHRKDIYR